MLDVKHENIRAVHSTRPQARGGYFCFGLVTFTYYPTDWLIDQKN